MSRDGERKYVKLAFYYYGIKELVGFLIELNGVILNLTLILSSWSHVILSVDKQSSNALDEIF